MSLQHASENTMSDTAMLQHTCRNEVTGAAYPSSSSSSSSSFFTLFIPSICKSVSFVRTILFSLPPSVVSQRILCTTGALRTGGQVTTGMHVGVTCKVRIYFKKTLRKLSSIGLQKQTHTSVYMEVFLIPVQCIFYRFVL